MRSVMATRHVAFIHENDEEKHSVRLGAKRISRDKNVMGMPTNQSLLDELRAHGLVAQTSNEDELKAHLTSARSLYCGFDPTADSLHVGNLVPLLALRRFQLAGHRPILLVGGATGMIGDPGGRSSERELKPRDQVTKFVKKIREQASRFLDFDCGEQSALVVDNADWIEPIDVITFLRDIGKHFSVNTMIQKETVRRRLEDESTGISYTEFSYMILQAYDYSVLNERFDCTLQIGGSDQWGNITSGIDLIRRRGGGAAHALTYPLITKSDGTKFGKSASGAIWLDPDKTSPYAFYQFWLNVADGDAIRFLRTFTFLSDKTIKALADSLAEAPERREAQQVLADEVTQLVHGEARLEGAKRISRALFSNEIESLTKSDFEQLALDGLPVTNLESEENLLLDALVASELAVTPRGEVTRGQARKLVLSNAISINGEKQTDEHASLSPGLARHGRYFLVKKGKKQHHLFVSP
jgi:tyrosyl-tRNA synthetase